MNFFRYFPTVPYIFSLPGDANTFFTSSMTNMTVHFKIRERLKQNITVFHDYIVQDGDRPDSVAAKVYGNVTFTWLVLLLNNIFSLFDWPLNNQEFGNFIVEKYGSLTTAQNTFLYRTVNNYQVDVVTYNLLDASARGIPLSVYDNELNLNEAKRRIRVVPIEFVGSLLAELKTALTTN